MRILKSIVLFVPLFFFVACTGPYHKPAKKPMKIGVAQLVTADAGDAGDAAPSIEDTPTLDNKGIGPITEVVIGDDIDRDLAAAGETTFNTLCVACHMVDKRFVGPKMLGITKLRSPEWIMNMILNPDEMLQKDPVAIALLEEYGAPMVYMGTTEDEARELVEYFRTLDE